ncbi:MAG: Asp/Glu/hydantoin racemase [Rhodobacteraceae bacterium]|nr:Asp/Glu/hydantoin racemase [Paracoccaceae bacterium]MAY43760.1 Asp/Glu/hydantoin racemase [Paracoccaceae bacterium]QEW20730.1 Hydantoin racemase [Marinibacterium anthonyi]
MKIAVINPNSTVSMTDKIADAARAVAGPDVEIQGRTCAGSPASIQGAADGEAAAPHLLAELKQAEADGAQAVVIACFDDTALAQARRITDMPVIGIGEAGYHAAILMGKKFTVVTTLSVSVPVLEQNLVDYGLASHCLKVRASEVPVLDLEKPGSDAREKISAEIARAIAEEGAGAIVLGCAGMADLAADLSRDHGVPVIDGVAAATGLARTLIGLRA